MKTLSSDLSVRSLKHLVWELNKYSSELEAKNARFISLLLDCGITVAQQKTGEGVAYMATRVTFEKQIESDGGYTLGYLIGTGDTMVSHWLDSSQVEHIDSVYPLAMLEFGSAAYALPPMEAFGGRGGQGTFAVSGNEMRSTWYVTKLDDAGNKKRIIGRAIHPTRPMYEAMQEMRKQLIDCATRAFGGTE